MIILRVREMFKNDQMRSLLFLFSLCTGILSAQSDSTYAERLGWPKGAKVLIMHVDDAGMSWDSNEGAIQALTKGVANSVSVMMPCGWVPGFVHQLKKYPEIDAGLHLTLTSEWDDYRWGPLSGKPAVPGLVDAEGALWPEVEDVVKNASADEVEQEIRAQLERARKMGFQPTHMDSHMGTLFASPAFLQRYVKVGIQERIPVMMPAGHCSMIAETNKLDAPTVGLLRSTGKILWDNGLPVLDDLHNETYGMRIPPGLNDQQMQKLKTKLLLESFTRLKSGVTMLIVHCTAPSPIFKHISSSGDVRKSDLLAMQSPELKAYLQKEGIVLTTWRELMQRRQALIKK
mgnify:FL=1